ncbi:Zn(II)2Cys6 transcription factor [Aspergillus luchuensis]|uniref:Zn(II)2Cys6 transcription factor n=1 Tax=Aspergillus kawachii TaxID=1069201 RepID=A0A146F8C2_ASPKA|nr:Zn(II)2Cys6 transcription factor [Aspergillus luchuensis]
MRKLTSSQWNSGSIEGTSMSRGPPYSLSSMPGPSEPVGASSLQRSSTTGASGTKDQAFLATAQTPFQYAPAVGQKDVTSSDIITSRPFTSSAAERLLKPEINIPPRRVLPWSSTSKRANTMTKAPPTVPYATVTSGTSSNIVARSNQLGMQTQTRPATSGESTTMPRLRLLPPKLPNAKNDRQQPHPESGPNISAHTGPHKQPPCLKAVNPPVVPSYPSIKCNLQAERTEASKLSTGKQGEAQQAKIMDALTTADLSSYISNPTEERMASLETWICNQLEDEGFLELCRDVEGIWQRIAFGR